MNPTSPRCGFGARASTADVGGERRKSLLPFPTRRFHLVGVGLPKTGTTSLARLFETFRWGDEFLFAESVERLIAWKAGKLDRDGTRRWLAYGPSRRAGAGLREFQPRFPGHPGRTPPQARFVYTAGTPSPGRLLEHGLAAWHQPQGLPLARMAGRARQAHGPSFDPASSPPPNISDARFGRSRKNCSFYARETARIEAALPPERSLAIATDGLCTTSIASSRRSPGRRGRP